MQLVSILAAVAGSSVLAYGGDGVQHDIIIKGIS